MLEEEIHVEALAQEASIEVGEYNQNGFDLAAMFPRLSTDSMPVFSVMRFLFSPCQWGVSGSLTFLSR